MKKAQEEAIQDIREDVNKFIENRSSEKDDWIELKRKQLSYWKLPDLSGSSSISRTVRGTSE